MTENRFFDCLRLAVAMFVLSVGLSCVTGAALLIYLVGYIMMTGHAL